MRFCGDNAQRRQHEGYCGLTRIPRVTRRSFAIGLATLGCAIPIVPSGIEAQSARIRRIGLALGDDTEGAGTAFRETLRELGYIEGLNLVIEARSTGCAYPVVQGIPVLLLDDVEQTQWVANAAADLARMDLDVWPEVPLQQSRYQTRGDQRCDPDEIHVQPGFAQYSDTELLEHYQRHGSRDQQIASGV